jgi:hypothetical protein
MNNRIMVYHRFWHCDNKMEVLRIPRLGIWQREHRFYKMGQYNGIGRLPKDEFYEIGLKETKTIDNLLSKSNYLFSDTKPCDADCSLFGVLTQIKYNDVGPFNRYLKSNFLFFSL